MNKEELKKLLQSIFVEELQEYANKRFSEQQTKLPTIKNFLPVTNGFVRMEQVDEAVEQQKKLINEVVDSVFHVAIADWRQKKRRF